MTHPTRPSPTVEYNACWHRHACPRLCAPECVGAAPSVLGRLWRVVMHALAGFWRGHATRHVRDIYGMLHEPAFLTRHAKIFTGSMGSHGPDSGWFGAAWDAHANMQYAACSMQHATCDIRHATCNMLTYEHATCNMQPSTCDMRNATCNMRHATYNIQHATCEMHDAASNM